MFGEMTLFDGHLAFPTGLATSANGLQLYPQLPGGLEQVRAARNDALPAGGHQSNFWGIILVVAHT